jgi:uncharacterized protein
MADWSKIGSRGRVDDRRAMGPTAVGGLGIVGVGIVLLFNILSGQPVDIGSVLNQLQNTTVQQQPFDTSTFEGADSYEVFVSTVLGSNNDLWSAFFSQNNRSYKEPTVVLFRGSTTSACDSASAASGPHYCPLDETIYIDETFFDELRTRFGGDNGDVAQAYVIAHEVGHHVQNLLGALDNENSNQSSIRTELQADCYAGLWAYSIKDKGIFENTDEIREALSAASAVGDDRIQKQTTGYVNPETWTHGSSIQRVDAFTRGYESGSIEACQ